MHARILFLQHDDGVFLNKIDHLDNSNFDPDIQPKLLYSFDMYPVLLLQLLNQSRTLHYLPRSRYI